MQPEKILSQTGKIKIILLLFCFFLNDMNASTANITKEKRKKRKKNISQF